MSIGRAYNPPTERGAALAPWPRQFVVPVKLLMMMSEQQPITIGCHLPSNEGFGDLPAREVGVFEPRAV